MSAGNMSISEAVALDTGSAPAAASTWEPRVNGVPASVQRKIRRGVASDTGVPPTWLAPTAQGLPHRGEDTLTEVRETSGEVGRCS